MTPRLTSITPQRWIVALPLLTLLALAGCSSGSSDSPSASSTSPTSATTSPAPTTAAPTTAAPTSASPTTGASTAAALITIKDYAYSGASTVAPGATVMVTNDDTEAHTVTADTGSAFAVTIQPGKTESFTAPAKAGTYAYHCDFHANMHGTLKVS